MLPLSPNEISIQEDSAGRRRSPDGRVTPSVSAGETYVFSYRAVLEKAPRASGVYLLHNARRWVYVGETGDIRESLFALLNGTLACVHREGPLLFSFETLPDARRRARQRALIAELKPVCASA
jgi:hypothetical protein